jgi:surfactin synthase thioesterase subunit
MQLFHGFKNRKARKVRPDPTGLTIFIEATPEMAYEYKELLEESQKKLIEHLIDSPFTLEDLLEDKERRDTNYKRIIEEKDNNGISQDP